MRNLGKLFLALCLLTVGGGIVANAQVDSETIIQANVPFAFVIGDNTLPAGEYEIRGIDDNTPGVLEVVSVKGRKRIVFETDAAQTRDNEPATKTELVFTKAGDKYFLSQVWVAGNGSGSELRRSKMEKESEEGGGQPERHSIAAILRHKKR